MRRFIVFLPGHSPSSFGMNFGSIDVSNSHEARQNDRDSEEEPSADQGPRLPARGTELTNRTSGAGALELLKSAWVLRLETRRRTLPTWDADTWTPARHERAMGRPSSSQFKRT